MNFLFEYFPVELTHAIELFNKGDIQEIRIIADKSTALLIKGKLTDLGVIISKSSLSRIVDRMCKGSLYSVQPTLARGYFTLCGGHRVGVCGCVKTENGQVTFMNNISSICIRIAREIKGAADSIIGYIYSGGNVYNTLIVSPPSCGKTTLLRDIARQIGAFKKVCIADERSEIASSIDGIAQNDVGRFTTVLDKVPKAIGIEMLLRTMSPDVIVTDETGSAEEEEEIYKIINCGVKIITSVHGFGENDILRRKHIGALIQNKVFERIIVLSGRNGPCTIEKIISDGRVIFSG